MKLWSAILFLFLLLPAITYAEPNFERKLFTLDINDTHASLLWAHENTGQVVASTTGTVDADMDVPEAWQLIAASTTSEVVVGIIDTGVLYTHPDLDASMWNPASCLDETGTTTTCIHGYDFENNDSDPLPDHFHGTHLAGISAAEVNNSLGVAGVASTTKIVALRFALDVASEVRAIDFAIQNGIKIINASYGGPQFSQAEYDAIERFKNAGGLFIAAAGNESADNDSGTHTYPADLDLDNIISVAATDQDDKLASFSNWGATSVDVAAPGKNILSTYLLDQYAIESGTSMSTAYVSGLAALIWSVEPDLTAREVKERILSRGDALPALSGKVLSGKRVNAYNSLTTSTEVIEEATTTPVEIPPPPPPEQPQSRGGGGGGGGGGRSEAPRDLKPGDLNNDNRFDLLDFNSLMIQWSTLPNAFADFNNLMVNWSK